LKKNHFCWPNGIDGRFADIFDGNHFSKMGSNDRRKTVEAPSRTQDEQHSRKMELILIPCAV